MPKIKMRNYRVAVYGTYCKFVTVFARSEKAAIKDVAQQWADDKIDLCPKSRDVAFDDVEFSVVSENGRMK